MKEIHKIAEEMVQNNKGILAADESTPSMNKRLRALNLPEEEEVRRKYRELLINTEGMEEYVSGIILYDETIRQQTNEEELFVDILKSKGVLPGIKVDQGLIDDKDSRGEKLTNGLGGLSTRLDEYKEMGAVFTKWRAVISIGAGLPTMENIERTGNIFAEYTNVVQEREMVPIIEPEVLKEGNHTIEEAEVVTTQVLEILFSKLEKVNIDFKGAILKTSMIISGNDSGEEISPEEVAERTIKVLERTVPEELTGVVFLSGGQKPIEATKNLNEIAKLGKKPWGITFSYSRAIQEPVLAHWMNEDKNVEEAQRIYIHRLKMNSLASVGNYSEEAEHEI